MAEAQLPTARLGSAGPEITRLGFGARAIGGGDWAHGWVTRTTATRSRPSATRWIAGSTGSTRWREGGDRTPRPNLRPDEVRRECQDSLRRLGVEALDLLQFHR